MTITHNNNNKANTKVTYSSERVLIFLGCWQHASMLSCFHRVEQRQNDPPN